jgi:hypothetical protein
MSVRFATGRSDVSLAGRLWLALFVAMVAVGDVVGRLRVTSG